MYLLHGVPVSNVVKRLASRTVLAARSLLTSGAGLLKETALRVVHGPGALRCSVCGHSVRCFRTLSEFYFRQLKEAGWPYGFDQAETCNVRQYSCPYCGAADRDRLLALFLGEWFRESTSPALVIDFAPAQPLSAFIRRQIAASGRAVQYRTADLMAAGVDDQVDITDMPRYATGSVDLWLCSHVLEHVVDDRKAMRELLRVLKPGGRGAVLVPIVLGLAEIDEDPTITDPTERWRRFGQDDHVRLYSKSGLVERLREVGFIVHEWGTDHFGAARFAELGIGPLSVLYVVERPTVKFA